MSPTRILLVGANGRLGKEIGKLVDSDPQLNLAGTCTRGDAIEIKVNGVDVAIDVSHPDATVDLCSAAAKNAVPLVIGTTGHSPEQRSAIANAARSIPIVLASNFSIGVNALFALTRAAGRILGPEFHPKVSETHHQMKKDAPSGTAKTIAQILQRERDDGSEIPIESIREGEVVGEHTVIFAGPNEQIELKHSAKSREIFARGALRAAVWILGKPARLYSMEDVLGLK
jgi:4-hydroxy-tetrahydrodipicolinate reductase